MFTFLRSTYVTIGLALFCMLFGAGNLIYPLKAGMNAGSAIIPAMLGFCLTAVFIPLLGFISIILYNGDYKSFFYRLGPTLGSLVIGLCMLLIGPFFASARLVTVSYGMLIPFLPSYITPAIFSIIFCAAVFIATYSAKKFMSLLSNVISPLLIISIGIIFLKGMMMPHDTLVTHASLWTVFRDQALLGYATLDLLGTIFFGSVILTIIKNHMQSHNDYNLSNLALTGMKGGLLGCGLLMIVYCAMVLLGAFFGNGFETLAVTQLFSAISLRILGAHGGFLIGLTVALACFSTLMALAAVLADYIHTELSSRKICFKSSLIIMLMLTAFISQFGLGTITLYAGPVIETLYPALIVLAALNILHKTIQFPFVVAPFLITIAISVFYNIEQFKVFSSLWS